MSSLEVNDCIWDDSCRNLRRELQKEVVNIVNLEGLIKTLSCINQELQAFFVVVLFVLVVVVEFYLVKTSGEKQLVSGNVKGTTSNKGMSNVTYQCTHNTQCHFLL